MVQEKAGASPVGPIDPIQIDPVAQQEGAPAAPLEAWVRGPPGSLLVVRRTGGSAVSLDMARVRFAHAAIARKRAVRGNAAGESRR